MTNQELDPWEVTKEIARRDAEIEAGKTKSITEPVIEKINIVSKSNTRFAIFALLISILSLGISIVSFICK